MSVVLCIAAKKYIFILIWAFCVIFVGGRRIRGGRARGNFPQASLSADGLNAEELTKNGVKVDILKKLMLNRQEEVDDGQIKSDNPPKLISLDQVTVRGEDLTSEYCRLV